MIKKALALCIITASFLSVAEESKTLDDGRTFDQFMLDNRNIIDHPITFSHKFLDNHPELDAEYAALREKNDPEIIDILTEIFNYSEFKFLQEEHCKENSYKKDSAYRKLEEDLNLKLESLPKDTRKDVARIIEISQVLEKDRFEHNSVNNKRDTCEYLYKNIENSLYLFK